MNSKVVTAIAFVVGAAVGAVASWRLIKKKYERITQEEIDSVKESLRTRREMTIIEDEACPTDDSININEQRPVVSKIDILEKKIDELGYTNYSKIEKKEKGAKNMSEPYVIKPEEFGENDEYETESLTYYADGVLTDDWDYPIEDIENAVGEDFAEHFGEYENDSVFIRNDRQKIDYEILYDTRKYSEIEDRP